MKVDDSRAEAVASIRCGTISIRKVTFFQRTPQLTKKDGNGEEEGSEEEEWKHQQSDPASTTMSNLLQADNLQGRMLFAIPKKGRCDGTTYKREH